MSKKQYWIKIKIPDDIVVRIKKTIDKKQERIKQSGYETRELRKSTLWTGTAGEYVFHLFLKEKGLVKDKDYKWHWKSGDTDKLDFTLRHLNIDVKTVARNVDPQEDYDCNVNKEQYDYHEQSINPVNCFVMVSYNLKTNEATILGWLYKDDFDKMRKEKKTGEMSSKMKVRNTLYTVKVHELLPMWSLGRNYENRKIPKDDAMHIDTYV